ncbi:monocarboxylate transporter 5-like [Mizuhopecten yessoensis]|uniref:Monocarboxylate transporter 5 n=1 Tax=Mizuhopecten yessoensis TaxID=6573 RepID=A0A210QXY0_MIZYE|nr:monocarboxylate transporter 5-like [Mizuhopecten yessoensis]XP_021346904.1 monocarboxylate transporter 5-like [Mizuhopecten yessoensis]XP_021346905.1 monocarboxylate transporter 5-like [Mizuhopecten yessoensis]OWF53583.1 Monocarboxylate transporter 5 [Mizuhopecten yessoensis]
MITSGIILNCTFAGALMRPIDQYQLESKLTNESFLKETEKTQDKKEMTNVSEISKIDMNQTLHAPEQHTECSTTGEIIRRKTKINDFSGSCISLTHLPNSANNIELQHGQDDMDDSKCASKCGILSQIFDYTLFKNPMFVILITGVSLGQIECALAHIFIPPYAKDQGLAERDIPLVAGTIGIAEFIGRFSVGILGDVQCIKRHLLIAGSLILTGTVTHFVHLYDNVWTFVLFSALYGMFSGVLVALYSPVCVDYLGIERFRKAYGICCCVTGIVTSVSAPIFGFLRDLTGSYVLTFHVMGSCALIGGSVFLLLPLAKRYEDRKLERTKIPQRLPLI